MAESYTISAAGVEDFVLFQPYPAPSESGGLSADYESADRSGPSAAEVRTPRTRHKKSRYTDRQKALRSLQVREFVRNHYLAVKRLKPRTVKLVNALLGHLARCRGQTFVRDLGDELLRELRDYFLGLIADKECGTANANKNLRQLKAIVNRAAEEGLLRRRTEFNAWLPEETPEPKALDRTEYWRIGQAAQAVSGFVGTVPGCIWWFAWYQVMSRAGNRLTALMLAPRGDYEHGVLRLRAENQKQHEEQRIQLPDYVAAAVEELLAAHDEPRLFAWPYDAVKPGQEPGWQTLLRHFKKKILKPAGIELRKGVVTKVFRQTAATVVESLGGSGTKLCGHSGRAVTKKHYLDPRQSTPITREALLIPEDQPPAAPQGPQLSLFQKEAG